MTDPAARLAALARERDPDTVFAAASAASPASFDATVTWTLRRVAAVFAGGANDTAYRACAALGYLTGRLVLDGRRPHAQTDAAPDPARAQRLLERVRTYDLAALERALGPVAAPPLQLVRDDATRRTVLRTGIGLALAEDELDG
ncbi:MAG: hypothetical protein ABUS54_13145 [Actinomycetota bacterium]